MSLEFKSSLLREKFVLKHTTAAPSDVPPVIALSNRMVLPLIKKGQEPETFVIRSQNMHSCCRLAAAITKEYLEQGAITSRETALDWDTLWTDVIKGYEKEWNTDIWCAVYYKGRIFFEYGERHPLLDIIEQCDSANGGKYTESVQFAESAFQQAGRAVKIEHDSNIALIVSITDDEAKCGVILRGANRKTTFNIIAKKRKGGETVKASTILTLCAAFLEGVQLSFLVGMLNKKISLDLIKKNSEEYRKAKRSEDRLNSLNRSAETIESKYSISYRPDKPNFKAMVSDAQNFAMAILGPQIEAKIASGEINPKDWIT